MIPTPRAHRLPLPVIVTRVLGVRMPILQDPNRRALKILELPGPQRPEKGDQPARSEQQRNRNQDGEPVHDAAERRRKELQTTTIDEQDIAIAAISGVTSPASASGMARRL